MSTKSIPTPSFDRLLDLAREIVYLSTPDGAADRIAVIRSGAGGPLDTRPVHNEEALRWVSVWVQKETGSYEVLESGLLELDALHYPAALHAIQSLLSFNAWAPEELYAHVYSPLPLASLVQAINDAAFSLIRDDGEAMP